jgi:hypothetical protein
MYTFAFTIQFQDNPPKYCDLRHTARKYLSFYSHSGHVETLIDSIKAPFLLNELYRVIIARRAELAIHERNWGLFTNRLHSKKLPLHNADPAPYSASFRQIPVQLKGRGNIRISGHEGGSRRDINTDWQSGPSPRLTVFFHDRATANTLY